MRIGVISDTHNHLPNVRRIVALLNAARVERVVHTGDITQAKTLAVLAGLDAPLVGVYGNNDRGERQALEDAAAGYDMVLSDPPLELLLATRRVLVMHEPRDLDTDGASAQVVLHGHTHRYRMDRGGGRLVFNPGECAGHVAGLNAVGVVDLATLEASLLRF
ncbi:MAG: YfcE family phosphodiesterase [bacterium]